jgi:hypothetical protein
MSLTLTHQNSRSLSLTLALTPRSSLGCILRAVLELTHNFIKKFSNCTSHFCRPGFITGPEHDAQTYIQFNIRVT